MCVCHGFGLIRAEAIEQNPVCGGKERNGNLFRKSKINEGLEVAKNERGHREKDEEEEWNAEEAKATRLRDEGRREKLLCRTLSTYPAHCLRCSDKHPQCSS